MKTKNIGLLIMTILTTSFTLNVDKGKIVKVEEFKIYIEPIGLQFEMPVRFKETYVKENNNLLYNFAIRDKKADFEVRYTVLSLKSAMEEYEKCKLGTNCLMESPNVIYKRRIQSIVSSMTGGQDIIHIGEFPPQALKKEFNADNGGSTFFHFNCVFGKSYKYGQMVYLHKDNVADVIITFMSNDTSTHRALIYKSFHALTFK